MSRKTNRLKNRLAIIESQDRRRRLEREYIAQRRRELEAQLQATLKAQLELVHRLALSVTTPEPMHHQPRIAQVAAMLVTPQGRTLAEYHALIIPSGWTMHPDAQAVHGITLADCTEFGMPLEVAMMSIEHMLQRAELAVAHNSTFDRKMLNIESERLAMTNRLGDRKEFFCTMRAMTNVAKIPGIRGYKWPKLGEAYRFLFNRDLEGAHDAMADVRACAAIYFEYAKQFPC